MTKLSKECPFQNLKSVQKKSFRLSLQFTGTAYAAKICQVLGWAGLLYLDSLDAVVVTSLASDVTQVTTVLTSC